jgi:hypothetical protein
MKDEYNPDDSIAEAELELAMGRLRLNKKKNPRKIIEEIASCEVKYGIPVSDSKKIAQLICLGGNKYGTIISVTQMCKRSEGKTCTSKHIVDKMWMQWQIKGGKKEGKEDNKEEASLAKTDGKRNKGKGKKGDKDDQKVPKKKETCTCNHCQRKGHIEKDCREKHPEKMPEKFQKKKDAKTEKAGVAVKEVDKHLLSFIDVDTNKDVEYKFHNNTEAFKISCVDINNAFIKAPIMEDDVAEALFMIKLGLEEDDIEDDETPSDGSRIKSTLQVLSSPIMWIGDTGATKHLTKYKQGGINPRPLTSRTGRIYGQAVKPANGS